MPADPEPPAAPAAKIIPRASPVVPIPDEDPLTPAQWKTLLALADAVVPAVVPSSAAVPSSSTADNESMTALALPVAEYREAVASVAAVVEGQSADEKEELARTYLGERASEIPAFRAIIRRMLAVYMPEEGRRKLTGILNMLK